MKTGADIERAILHAAVAGGLRYWARKDARATKGLLKAADHHSAKAAALISGMELRAAHRND